MSRAVQSRRASELDSIESPLNRLIWRQPNSEVGSDWGQRKREWMEGGTLCRRWIVLVTGCRMRLKQARGRSQVQK